MAKTRRPQHELIVTYQRRGPLHVVEVTYGDYWLSAEFENICQLREMLVNRKTPSAIWPAVLAYVRRAMEFSE